MAKNTRKYIELRQDRDFGQALNATFEFTFSNFGHLFRVIFSLGAPVIITGVLMVGSTLLQLLTGSFRMGSRYGSNLLGNLGSSGIFFMVAGYALILIGAVIFSITVIGYFMLYEEKKRADIPVKEVWQWVRKNFFRFLLGLILFIIFFGISVGMLSFLPKILGPTYGTFFLFLGYIALIYYCYFFPFAMAETNFNPFRAIGRSFSLVSGKWWFVFGNSVVLSMAMFMVLIALEFGVLILVPVFKFSFLSDSIPTWVLTLLTASGMVLVAVVYFTLTLMYMINAGILYFSISERYESTGLLSKLELIGGVNHPEEAPSIKVEKNKEHYSHDDVEEEL